MVNNQHDFQRIRQQYIEAVLEHLVSVPGAEIRQFILTEISKIAKIEKIDVNDLAISIDTVPKILEANKQGLSLFNGLVEGNKLEIGKAKRRFNKSFDCYNS